MWLIMFVRSKEQKFCIFIVVSIAEKRLLLFINDDYLVDCNGPIERHPDEAPRPNNIEALRFFRYR